MRSKRHLIILPPPQNRGVFGGWGGGVTFFNNFMNFWVGTTKKIGGDFEQSRCFGMGIGRFLTLPQPFYTFVNFKKSGIFSIFWANLAVFVFKMRFWAKLVPRTIKYGFFVIVWILKMVYIDFLSILNLLKFWVFMHFFMLKSVVFKSG